MKKEMWNRLKEAWKTIRYGIQKNIEVEKITVSIEEEKINNLIQTISKKENEVYNMYNHILYTMIKMTIPNEKHAIFKESFDEMLAKMVQSISLYCIIELEKILPKINESNRKVSSDTPTETNSKQ